MKIEREDLKRLNDPQKLIKERQHIGSPAPDRVQEQVAHLRSVLDQNHASVLKVINQVQQARAQCLRRSAEVLKDKVGSN